MPPDEDYNGNAPPGEEYQEIVALDNKNTATGVLLDVYYVIRDVLEAAMSPVGYGQSP